MAGALVSGLGLLGLLCSIAACASSTDREGSLEGADEAGAAGDAIARIDLPGSTILCSDGQIAATMGALSEAEVSLAQGLRERFTDRNIAALADHMLTEHSLLLEQLKGATRAGQVAPADCGLARAIASAAGAETASLQPQSGQAVDRAYAEREVLSHLQSLALIDTVFRPVVQSERIAYAVRVMREIEAQHTATALAAQRALEGACAPPDGD